MKILFFLTSRYPTHKAYGVTTGETARELGVIGNEVKIFAPWDGQLSTKFDDYKNEVIGPNSALLLSVRQNLTKIAIVREIIFVFTSIAFTSRSVPLIRREHPDVIWLRDYWATFVIQKFVPKSRIVIEVHKKPSVFNHIFLRYLVRKHNISIITIQVSLRDYLRKRYPKAQIFLGPMGASNDFFEIGRIKLKAYEVEKLKRPLEVCYLGRLKSSGKDNGLSQVLNNWRSIPSDVANLTIIGFTESEIIEMSKFYSLSNLTFLSGINHNEVPKVLLKMDCGLVPYPEGHYHRTRFPIKVVEYCASAMNIIATDTKSNQEILNSDFCDFYEVGDANALLRILRELKENRMESRYKAERGHIWAKDYTYNKRLKEIYPFLERCVN